MSLMTKVIRHKNVSNIYKMSRTVTSTPGIFCSNKQQPESHEPQLNEVNFNQVTGLSTAVLKEVPEKFVPGTSKSGDYKNPEYFSYHTNSYFEAEIEMLKYRCPQPSSLNKN